MHISHFPLKLLTKYKKGFRKQPKLFEKFVFFVVRSSVDAILLFAVLGTPFYSKMCVFIVRFTGFLILQSQNRNHTHDIFENMNKKTMLL